MATVKITITDAPHGVTAVVEADPSIPLKENGDPDVDSREFTGAMAIAVGALMELTRGLEGADWRVLLRG